jgi:hypothetical protein
MTCQECSGPLGDVRWRFVAVREPYNPEWAKETVAAGEACSAGCLVALLQRRHHWQEVPPRDDPQPFG